MTVGALKRVIYSRSADLRARFPNDEALKTGFFLASEESKRLQKLFRDEDLVVQVFPGAGVEKIAVVAIYRTVQVPVPSRGVAQSLSRRDVAAKAAKKVRAVARVDEDRLVNALLEQCSEATLAELAEFKKPGDADAGGKKRSSATVDARKLEWTKFYTAIKDNVKAALEIYGSHEDKMIVGIVVDSKLSLTDFADSLAQNHNGVGLSEIDTLKKWVGVADHAVRTCQRFSIANCIALGMRLQEARDRWDQIKATQEATNLGLHTLQDFYREIGLEYTVDYVRKLIHLGRLGGLFPNLALISCCGIGEIIKFVPEFMEFMKSSPQDAKFWRVNAQGAFGWSRVTSVLAYEGTKRQKVFEFNEEAADEPYADWMTQGATSMTEMLAEREAANRLEAEEAEQMEEYINDAVADMEAE